MNINKEAQLINSRLIRSPDELYIRVPAKLPKAVNHLDLDDLKQIDSDPSVAKELCLYLCSFLQSTYLNEEISTVGLHSDILMEVFGCKYRKIIDVLERGTPEKGSIIQCDGNWKVGIKSIHYWFADAYTKERGNYLVPYKFKKVKVQTLFIENLNERMLEDRGNPIINNLYHVYSMVGLPSTQHLREKGKKLVAQQKTSKKGKLYKFCNRNRSRFSEEELKTISFIEDGIRRFTLLTEKGFIPPHCQGKKAGNRISDTFTSLNSWIREEITLNGRQVVECDFKCLHPNLAMSVYGGGIQYLTHKSVAEYCGIDIENKAALSKFKTDHLAFFNKKVPDMKRSKAIHEFYLTHEPEMLSRIQNEKDIKRDHTVTCTKLFAKEVEIMTKCIEKLNAQDVYVLYVFDALLCDPHNQTIVEHVMNETAFESGVYTATYDMNEVFDQESSEGLEPIESAFGIQDTGHTSESKIRTQNAPLSLRGGLSLDSLLGLSA